MNGHVQPITLGELLELAKKHWPKEIDQLTEWGRLSSPLLAGMWSDEVICVFGFVPETLLSDQAYLWLNTTQAAESHKVAFGRFARRLMVEARKRYPIIVGHCTYSAPWLRSLGARVVGNQFIIGA